MNVRSNRKHVVDLLFPLALFFVFAVSSLLVILLAADVYQSTTVQAEANDQGRTALLYVTEKIHQGDVGGGVSIGSFDGHDAVILTQDGEKQRYQTYIYEDGGILRELFIQEGTQVSAADGREIMEISEFRMEQLAPGLFRFSCAAEEGMELSTVVSAVSR